MHIRLLFVVYKYVDINIILYFVKNIHHRKKKLYRLVETHHRLKRKPAQKFSRTYEREGFIRP